MAKANVVRWYGYVLKRDDEHVLSKALEFKAKAKRKRGRPKKTWKMWRRRARVLVWRKMMPRIEQDEKWDMERLLAK